MTEVGGQGHGALDSSVMLFVSAQAIGGLDQGRQLAAL